MTSREILEQELTELEQALFRKRRELAVLLLCQLGKATTTTERQRLNKEVTALEQRLARQEMEERVCEK